MTNKSGSGKKPDAAAKASPAKSQKSARGRTIELTAEDVTPSDKKPADKTEAPKTAPKKSEAPKAADASPKDKPQDKSKTAAKPSKAVKRGGFGVFLIAAFTGAALALGTAYGLLFYKVIALPDAGKAQMLDAISGLEARIQAAGTQNEEHLGALGRKTQSTAQIYADMLAKTNASVAALKDDLAALSKKSAGLEGLAKSNSASLGTINTAAQSALKAAGALGLKLDKESKSRAQLGPHIAANTAQVQKRATEMAALSKDLETVKISSGRLAAQMDDLFKGLKDIEKAVAEAGALGGGTPSSAGVRISLLGNKFKRLEQDMAGLNNTLQSLPAIPPDVTPRITVLEKSLSRITRGIADLGARDAGREDALRRLQGETQKLGHNAARIASVDKRLGELGQRLAKLQTALGVVGKAADTLKIGDSGSSGALNALAERINTVRAEMINKIERLEKVTAEISDAETKLSAIDARLKDVKSAQAAFAVQQQLAAKVQSAGRLQRDLLSGGAFKDALFAFIELAPDVKVPENVSALAASGILTPNQLRKRFKALKQGLEAQNILEGGTGLMGKLLKSAGSVVSVRRTGPTAGTSSGAVASRVATHLEKGQLAAALKEAAGFKGDALEQAAPWIKQAQARLEAEAFAANLSALVYSGGKGE